MPTIHVRQENAPKCPTCGEILSAHLSAPSNGADPRGPQPGDVIVCSQCVSALEIMPDQSLIEIDDVRAEQLVTPEAFAEIQRFRQLKKEQA
jgi:hypothetical protein